MPGVILVAIGVVFLLDNFNVIDFRWENLFYLWPVFLIMGGVNLLLANQHATWATITKIAVVTVAFGFLIFTPTKHKLFWNHSHGNFNFSDHDNDNDDDDDQADSKGVVKIEGTSKFNEPFTVGTEVARFNIHGGGAVFNLNDTTSQLFEAQTKESFNRYEYNKTMDGTVPVIDFRMKNKKGKHFEWDSDNTNTADIKLNAAPIWDINVNTGASELNFDLSKFKLRNLTINGGAASYDVKLGMPLETTNVKVSTGVSEVHIRIPQGAAAQINANNGLNSKDFSGFVKKDGNIYQTPGFDSAKNKIFITMQGGISDYNVSRY